MELEVRARPAMLQTTTKKPLFPLEVPSLRVIHGRFQKLHTVTGTPYYLPTYQAVQQVLGDQATGRFAGKPVLGGNPPWSCVGPSMRTNQRRAKFACFKHNFCLYCAERKAWRSAQRAVRAHHANEYVHRFSVSLPGVRTQPELVKDAKKRLARVLRDFGYTELSLNVHIFGENPFEGPKGHLDGIASGQDPDSSILENLPLHARLEAALQPYHVKPDGSSWQIHISSRALANRKDEKAFLRDLILAGYYSGRTTLKPRRIFAGMYGKHPFMQIRMTNVQRGQQPKEVRDMHGHDGRPLRHYSQAELIHAQVTAEKWEDIIGRPVYAREPPVDQAMWSSFTKNSGWWRHVFRLPDEFPETG